MTPTTARSLVAAVAISSLACYLLLKPLYSSLPAMPWFAVVTVALIAVVEWLAAHSLRARLAGRPGSRPVEPIAVARTAAFAKASSLAGAIVAGAWIAVVATVAPDLDKVIPRQDAIVGVAGVVASVALILAALRLENACRVKPPPAAAARGEPGRRP